MDKKKMEIAAAALLIAVFVFVLAGSLGKVGKKLHSSPKPASQAAAPSSDIAAWAGGNIKTAAKSLKESMPEPQGAENGEERDPFALPDNPSGRGGEISNLVLTGITKNGAGKAIALINDSILPVGGKISKFTVINITADKVVLTDGKQNFELKLER